MKRLFAAIICVLGPGLAGFAQTTTPASPAGAPAAQKPVPAKPPAGAAPGTIQPAAPGTSPAANPAAGAAAARPRFTGHLAPEPEQFIQDAVLMLTSTANPGAKALAEQLRQLWGSNKLTASQQRSIATLSQQMLDKQYKVIPHLTAFYSAVVMGKSRANLSDAQTDQLLDALTQAVAKSPQADVEKFLRTTSQVFNGSYLHRTGFNRLRVVGGQYSFAYKGGADVDPNASFDTPAANPLPAAAATKPAAVATAPAAKTAAAKPAAAKPKPKPAAKKRASDGWDSGDLWSSGSKKKADDGWGSNDGWGGPPVSSTKKKADDGWGAPSKKNDGWGSTNDGWGAPVKKAPAKKSVAKATPAKTTPKATPAAGAPAGSAPAKPTAADFDQPDIPFAPSAAAALAAYYPPPVSGPVLELKDADIVVAAMGDSMVLHHVSGTVAPNSSRLLASGADIAWTIKGNPVSAHLEAFDFDLTKPEFTAQPATLTYDYLLEKPVKGAVSYKATRRKPGTESAYPRFISLTNDVRIKNVGPGLTYQGGLTLAGTLVRSAALDGSVSHITMTQEGKKKFRADSRNFLLTDSLLTADRTGVALYEASGDSLTHPGVELKYAKGKEQLKLLYDKGMYRTTPYADSYHQVYVRAQMVTWNLKEPKLEFVTIVNPKQVAADFESRGFYSNTRYQRLKTINHLHPLQMLVNYSQTHGGSPVLNLRNVAEDTKTSEANLRSAALGLVREGYVDIRPQTGEVVLLPKARVYVAAAREKHDYDHVALHSLSGSGRSATLNMASNQLLVRGIQSFRFTDDSAAVPIVVQPDSGIVRLEKNRNMHFSGRVKTSIYGFKGRDFAFDYDGYYIDMPRIDSLTIRSKPKKKAGAKTADQEHRPSDFVLSNKSTGQSGRLYLNDPRNRSGRKKLVQFPSFNSTSGAYVYFNKPDVLGGAYDSTTYFDVPPFRFDSMSTGKSRAGFVGVFHSKALPPIKTALTTQEDGSLGFVHKVPAGGYALYGGKGKLSSDATVKLNAGGLQSNGTVTYLGATIQSDRFVMYGDSLTGEGKAGSIAAGPNYPKVVMPPGFLLNWAAQRDSMFLQTPPSGASVKMYADHTFKGSLLLTPKKLGGAGRLDGPQSYVRSEDLTFTNDTYSGKQGLLSVKSATPGKPSLTANNVDFTYDLKKGYADFKGQTDGKSNIDLPYAAFRTSLSGGRWDFKKKRVTLRASGADSARAYFASTKPEQHGLKFKAAAGTYDLAKNQLDAKGVPYVAVGDAWVIPDSGRVAVGGGGQLRQFRHAKVLLDSLGKFHKLVDGNLTVVSRDELRGDAKYMSKGANGDSVALKFSNFQPDSAGVLATTGRKHPRRKPASEDEGQEAPHVGTIATANVEANQKFQLAPRVGYRGAINLNSQKRGLIFDGQVQLQFGLKRTPATAEWFAVKDSIDPKNIALNIHNLKSEDGTPLSLGFFVNESDNALYPLYGGPTANEADIPIFKADGTLTYDQQRGEYTVADHDLSDNTKLAGSVLTYHEATNRFDFRGPMAFVTPNKHYGIAAAGVGTTNPDSALYKVRTLLGIDIDMPEKAVVAMAGTLARLTKNSPEALDGSDDELRNIAQLAGDRAAEALSQRRPGAAPPSLSTVSPKLLHTVLLSKADLRWSPKHKAWYSVGQLGLAGVGKTGLNALVNGYVEIKRQDAQDVVELYLEPEPGAFFYIRYANNTVLTRSSDDDYDGEISGKQKGSIETTPEYGVFLGEFDDVDRFRAHFERDYLGKTGKLAPRPAAPAPAAEPGTDPDKAKKKKKAKDNDPFGEGTIDAPAATAEPAAEPATEKASKKKKKAKDNDPFGEGTIDAPAAEPAPEPAKKAKKEKAKDAEPTPDPTAAPAEEPKKSKKEKAKEAEPAADPAATEPAPEPKKSKKEKAKEAEPAPDPNAAAAPAEEPKKSKKEKAKEADAAPAATPADEPAAEPDKKQKKEKKKKEDKAVDDPFGDS